MKRQSRNNCSDEFSLYSFPFFGNFKWFFMFPRSRHVCRIWSFLHYCQANLKLKYATIFHVIYLVIFWTDRSIDPTSVSFFYFLFVFYEQFFNFLMCCVCYSFVTLLPPLLPRPNTGHGYFSNTRQGNVRYGTLLKNTCLKFSSDSSCFHVYYFCCFVILIYSILF